MMSISYLNDNVNLNVLRIRRCYLLLLLVLAVATESIDIFYCKVPQSREYVLPGPSS